MTDFTQLKDFLLSTFRQDVIIPCQKGMKFPSFAYRQNLWTWNDLDKIINKNIVEVDYAIILKTLCVIDCDTEAAAQDLTDTFPCLLTAPCAKTNRGFHFYFRRSVLADREGFWDQIGTKINKIDFKTRCQTGTGGIVVVPPSTNKTWLRPLWNTSLIDIPDELLTHVAIATGSLQLPVDDLDENELDEHNSISSSGFSNKNDETKDEASLIHTVILEFQNEDSMEVSGIQLQHLKDADYFSALLSGRWVVEETDTIPKFKIESDMETFKEIFALLDQEQMSNTIPPSPELLAKMDSAIDMFGFQYPRNPLLMRNHFFADLYDISKDWWKVHVVELNLMLGTSSEASDANLVLIDDNLADITGYEALIKDERWLFEKLPLLLDAKKCEGYQVFVDDPSIAMTENLPPIVMELLRLHPNHLVVAGGAVLGAVSSFAEHGTDIDLFVYGLDQNESISLVEQCEALVEQSKLGTFKKTASVAAITFTKLNPEANTQMERLQNRPFQIILGLHRSRSQILEYFDMAPCKALARMDEISGELVVEGLPSFVLSLKNMCFVVDIKYWSPSSVTRITKYVAKGFEVFIPGIKRSAFKKEYTTEADHFETFPQQKGKWSTSEGFTNGPKSYLHSKNRWSWKKELIVPEDALGMGVLFIAESDFLRSRSFEKDVGPEIEWVESITGRLNPIEAAVIAAKCAGKLGQGRRQRGQDVSSRVYGKRATGTYGFIRESFRRDVAVRIGDHRRDIPIKTQFFAFTEAGRFQPAEAHMESLYDPEALDRVCNEEMAKRANDMSVMSSTSSDVEFDLLEEYTANTESYYDGITCAACSSPHLPGDPKFKACSGCTGYYYCDVECQKSDWHKVHKNVCKKLKKRKKNNKN